MAAFIEFIDVHKSFGDRTILDGVTFSVEKGTTFAILGPSGIGKTVTITHIIGLLKPDSGKIIVDGQEVTRLSERELAPLRKKVQLVFQSGALFDSMTVWENVAFPLRLRGRARATVRDRVDAVLALIGLRAS